MSHWRSEELSVRVTVQSLHGGVTSATLFYAKFNLFDVNVHFVFFASGVKWGQWNSSNANFQDEWKLKFILRLFTQSFSRIFVQIIWFNLFLYIFPGQVWAACTTSWTIMSTSGSEEWNTCPPCTKPWMGWKTLRTTHQHTSCRTSAGTNWTGETNNWYWLKRQWYLNIWHLKYKYEHFRPTVPSFFVIYSRVPPFALLHGTSDIIVPVESSTKFSELLTSLSVKASLYLLPRVDHVEIMIDLMASDRRFYHPIYGCIKQEHRKLLTSEKT